MDKIKAIRQLIEKNNVNAILIIDKYNRRYISEFTGSAGMIFISAKQAIFITDSRYTEQAQYECTGFEVIELKENSYIDVINELIAKEQVETLGFEDETISYKLYSDFKEKLKIKYLKGIGASISNLRMIKSEEEIKNIQEAVKIGDMAFEHILKYIKIGVSEKDIELEIEYFMKQNGAQALSFDIIVASGVHSSMPHATPTIKKIDNGEFITMDFGCIYNGYCSDMTRTVVVGKPSEKQKKIYNIVLEAQKAAIEFIKSGVLGKDVDQIARDIISENGYGEFFGHGLGHSVGLYIHEEPRLSPKSEAALKSNMIFTVEPGIYIPEWGGVRIEDMGMVTDKSFINFTKSSKEFIEI